ncbi:MAG: hypothetical protein AAFO59_09480, partial [Cyanobacteria bacterium J06607_17]
YLVEKIILRISNALVTSNDECPLSEVVDNAWGMLFHVAATGAIPLPFVCLAKKAEGVLAAFVGSALLLTSTLNLPNSKNSPSRFNLVRLINPRTQKSHDTLSAA